MGLGVTPAWSSDDETVANELTTLLKASRAVLVQNKPLIKNPKKASIDVNKFLAITYKNYEKATGKKFKKGSGNVGEAQDKLIQAIEQVVDDVVSGKDTALDPQGRFLPAIFARKAAAKFGQVSGGKMTLKLTTRDEYLVNASNKADTWEKGVIDGKFLKKDWKKGKAFSQVAEHEGKKAFRRSTIRRAVWVVMAVKPAPRFTPAKCPACKANWAAPSTYRFTSNEQENSLDEVLTKVESRTLNTPNAHQPGSHLERTFRNRSLLQGSGIFLI
jgi:hypothetical protein